MIGYAFCGSFCTLSRSLGILEGLAASGEEILPIFSETVANTDTRFTKAADFTTRVEQIAGRPAVRTVKEAEPLGPATPLDLLLICPCTGNTLAKIAHGITDTPVTMAAKAHLRADRPLVIALATNDAMSQNLANLAALLTRKQVYFVPMKQDDPEKKPHSLVFDATRVAETVSSARRGIQPRPLFL